MPANKLLPKGLTRALASPAWVSFVWFGMTAGISLLEAPARFSTDSLSRAAALDLGRVVFTALNKTELVLLIVLLIVVRLSGNARRYWIECGALVVILIAQSVWLLPVLSARSLLIVSGGEPEPSIAHGAYAMLEVLKLILLLLVGFRSLAAHPTGSSLQAR